MKKIAILFAGQGSQSPGMGKSLYDSNPFSRAVFDQAGEDIKSLCFEGTAEELAKTEHTQPCVYATGMAVWAAVEPLLREYHCPVAAMAGFSLGEWSALTAAGLFPLETGSSLVRDRAIWMAEAAGGKGGMCAVMGDLPVVETLCREASDSGMVLPVNYNCPGQTVVAADRTGMERFLPLCREHSLRAVPLPVGGPFHSPLLQPAADQMRERLCRVPLGTLTLPVYGNLDGKPYTEDTAVDRLSRQLMSPVRWETTIRNLLCDGVDFFIEIGPGKTLTGLNRRIDRHAVTCPVDSAETLQTLHETIKGATA